MSWQRILKPTKQNKTKNKKTKQNKNKNKNKQKKNENKNINIKISFIVFTNGVKGSETKFYDIDIIGFVI